MCLFCQKIIRANSFPHTPIDCPYRKSLYCSICCIFGHSKQTCPNEIAKAIRKGEPIDNVKNRVLRIVDCPDVIKTYLEIHQIPNAKNIDSRQRKQRLLDLANSMDPPRMLVLVPPKKK